MIIGQKLQRGPDCRPLAWERSKVQAGSQLKRWSACLACTRSWYKSPIQKKKKKKKEEEETVKA
jgi:hypothetical protein